MKIALVLGTRPEIIKFSPIIRVCVARSLDFMIVHTNQHYAANLDQIFFEQLLLPVPEYNLGVGSGTHGKQTGAMLEKIEGVFLAENPDVVLVLGDTNTALSGALVARKIHVRVGHIEAGLRSYDRTMPEETNRILIDHMSDDLFAPTPGAAQTLLEEGIPDEKILESGNPIVDAVLHNLKISADTGKALDDLALVNQDYSLLTLHRAGNTDNQEAFGNLLKGLGEVARIMPIVWPIHPRAEKMLSTFSLKVPNGIRVIPPLGFLDFLQLQANARLILTDSGGVQEESCILRVPCVTLRENTERPETLKVGSNALAGNKPDKILQSVQKMLLSDRDWPNPFGDGRASEYIVDRIVST